MIPGSNLLDMAFSVISEQTVVYYKFNGRTLNDVGQDITSYDAPVAIGGSFQPVPRRLYEQYGLDLQKSYFTFYASKNILDVSRNVSGDQIAFQGQRYQCESANDWFAMDGWVGMLCVHVGNDFGNTAVFGFNTSPETGSNVNFDNGTLSSDTT